MKKKLIVICGILLLALNASSVNAATKAEKFKNCTELNGVYKGGVAQSSDVKNQGGKTKYKPYVSKELYDLNRKMDRDKDLIACEK
ncbi:excalibur calcium-binding domain-containing protein [Paenibacillus sp. NFR01]|uniref:excalibur calcium-binding domain-containing protein n=1 Tax=Paenibacillus sp. NFR01 TaxID=1566279 RepID=UPI0008CB25A1|nr:excalibur calcium-binding domain-containing protein [Paenibacillus sp. NFR01]SEU19525.1 Excalibur calcium-binding domain-containing protein [Paenibacillus sp. NFR01]